MKRALLLLTILISLAACESTEQAQEPRCEQADQAEIQAIRAGVKAGSPSSEIGPAFAVPSSDFEHVVMVAATIVRPDGEVVGPGVWAIAGGDEFTHTVLSVNVTAAEYSRYADNFQTDAGVTMEDDGAREAEACALAGAAPTTPDPAAH